MVLPVAATVLNQRKPEAKSQFKSTAWLHKCEHGPHSGVLPPVRLARALKSVCPQHEHGPNLPGQAAFDAPRCPSPGVAARRHEFACEGSVLWAVGRFPLSFSVELPLQSQLPMEPNRRPEFFMENPLRPAHGSPLGVPGLHCTGVERRSGAFLSRRGRIPRGVQPCLYRCSEQWNVDGLGMFGGLGRLETAENDLHHQHTPPNSFFFGKHWELLTLEKAVVGGFAGECCLVEHFLLFGHLQAISMDTS